MGAAERTDRVQHPELKLGRSGAIAGQLVEVKPQYQILALILPQLFDSQPLEVGVMPVVRCDAM